LPSSWANWIQSAPSQPTSAGQSLILSSHFACRFPKFLQVVRSKSWTYFSLLLYSIHSILLDFITLWYLFIYLQLLNRTFSSSLCIALDERMINEYKVRKNMEGSGHGLIWSTNLAFAWMYWGKLGNIIGIAGLQAEIWTRSTKYEAPDCNIWLSPWLWSFISFTVLQFFIIASHLY
jgi:hypothetical protein